MEIAKSIFRKYDIRGIYPEEINEYVIDKIAKAISIMANCLDIDLGKVVICNELYTFNMMEVFDFIRQIDNKFSNVLLIGHNPAFTEISNYFSENKILNLPTARWFSLKFDTDLWSNTIDLKPIHYLNNINNES